MRVLTESEVNFELTWEPETDIAPDFDDPTVREWVERRVHRGHVEAWCEITVTAAWTLPATGQVYTARASLGGCSLDGTGKPDSEIHRLIETHARQSDLYTEALDGINERLRAIITEAATLSAYLEEPRRSPHPCCEGCKGWEVFEVNRCTVHGDECELDRDDCSTLEIEACDACWYDVPDAADDDYYQAHPVCQAQLAAERGAALEPEECEDNACAGCPWCDREECITKGDHLVECDGDGSCVKCGVR